jgi:pantoate--beta-alanine ligase
MPPAAKPPFTPQIVRTIPELRRITAAWRRAGETSALIPTMGALHDGHLALVRAGQDKARRTVVSIFVNPTQFAPHEDFSRYPRDEAGDLAKLETVGCDLVWAPDATTMYPPGSATRVHAKGAAVGLESDFRPHFFEGVATVCCKLFTQVAPDVAIFGEKDYQQLAVVTQMARDLDLPLTVIGLPTVREADGLAMSSRNRYLSVEDRQTAVLIPRVIADVKAAVAATGATVETIAKAAETAAAKLTAAGFKVDYVAVCDAGTLQPYVPNHVPGAKRPARVLVAAWIGKTRLIDNA